jgi:hypothetical protein
VYRAVSSIGVDRTHETGVETMKRFVKAMSLSGVLAAAFLAAPLAQTPAPAGQAAQPPAGGRGGPRLVLSVTSTAWPDGGEVPMTNAARGENKSPAFEFHWSLGPTPASPPENLQSYAVIFHDIENSTNRGTADTLHWSAFNIPGTAKGLPEGLGKGDLPDGTRNGPGSAGPGPFHHYVFEFYALDTKLDLPASTTREDLLKAMEGHVIGKAAYTGRFRTPSQ